MGYTAPGVDGQARVISGSPEVADVKPETIGYVERHATGTALGDSIELAAMTRVFSGTRAPPGGAQLGQAQHRSPRPGRRGSRSDAGGDVPAHRDLAWHVRLPEAQSDAGEAAGGRFTVLTESRPWPKGPRPRRAGVSSFGLGGTNAHVVLEEAPARPSRPTGAGPHLLTFSAANPAALTALTRRIRDHLDTHREENLADVAYTLQISRGHFGLRRAVVVHD